MTIRELENFAQECINKKPELVEVIKDFVDLCKDNIDEYGNDEKEISMCVKELKELM